MFYFKNYSIKNKLITIILLVSTIASIAGYLLILNNDIAILKDNMRTNSIMNASLIAEYAGVQVSFGLEDNTSETLDKLKAIKDIEVGIIYKADGAIFTEYLQKNARYDRAKFLPKKPTANYIEGYLEVFHPIIYQGEAVGTLQLLISTSSLDESITNYVYTIGLILLLVIIISTILAYFFQKILSKPIIKLTEATRKIGKESDYSLRVFKTTYDEIGDLYDEFNKMLSTIQLRESERDGALEALQHRTEELTHTLNELKAAQSRIIQSEKMAALGQLVAGVAHEVNTPLGAIRSSITNIQNSLNTLLQDLPSFYRNIESGLLPVFNQLILRAVESTIFVSSKEERQYRRSVTRELEELDVENADSLADLLVDMGIYSGIDEYKDIFAHESGSLLMENAYKLSGIFKSTKNISLAADKAANVVLALKTYSRAESSEEKSTMSIKDSIETVLTLYHNLIKHGVEVIRTYDELPNISCYCDELNQVWTNIVHNALQAMNGKGKLEIQIRNADQFAEVRIIDSGTGIPENIKDKIFEPFFTTKPQGEGSGLGLDIVKKIIDKHNGQIEVESEPGRTCFIVRLPIE